MRTWSVLVLAAFVSCLIAIPVEAKKKKQKAKPKRAVVEQVVYDPTREAVYVRYDLLSVFWGSSIEPPLQPQYAGITPYAGLNAWVGHKFALGCAPCELPDQAKAKYCNHWIEDQALDVRMRRFRTSPEGWCYPSMKKDDKKDG